MRRVFLVPFLLLALTGCAKEFDQLKQVVSIATTTIANPVDSRDIYRAKNVYAATLQFASDWREYCWSKPYAVLIASTTDRLICENRRSRLRTIQLSKAKAASALSDAQIFVLNHPTLDATSVVTAMWSAVTNFKNAVPAQ